MNAKLSLGFAAFLALTPVAAGTAQSADLNVTFTVPFSASNMSPAVTKVHVICRIYDGNGTQQASAIVEAPIASGAYGGASLKVPVKGTVDTKPASWICGVNLLEGPNGVKCPAIPDTSAQIAQYPFCVFKLADSKIAAQGKF